MRRSLSLWIGIVAGVALGPIPPGAAGELEFRYQAGDRLEVQAVAEQQAWRILAAEDGPRAVVAAVVADRLILEDFPLPFGVSPGPGPNPRPDPQPDPDPQPEPRPDGPRHLLWIEETSARTPGEAAAVTDHEIREALAAAGWSLRVADVDVIDEQGKTPSELAPFIAAARERGLPRLFVRDAAGAEVYAGRAPTDTQSFRRLLTALGLSAPWKSLPPRAPSQPDSGTEAAPVGAATPPSTGAGPDCQRGRCPVPTSPPPSYSRRWFRR